MGRMSSQEDPLEALVRWYERARVELGEAADVMALATVCSEGWPSVRMVLLRAIRDGRLHFFTNYDSRKGRELDATGRAAVALYWAKLGQQVRCEGTVQRLSAAESDAYFASRPRASQLASALSPQSAPIAEQRDLLAELRALQRRHAGRPIERPAHWGGYALRPTAIELWQQGEHRLHRRVRYERRADGWLGSRLAP